MAVLDKISRILNQIFIFTAGCFLVALILLICANIFSRLIWIPVKGTFELMGYFGAIITAFALSYTQAKKGHIAVDILVNRFSERTRRVINGINFLFDHFSLGFIKIKLGSLCKINFCILKIGNG